MKIYSLTATYDETGLCVESKCDGFNPLELLGILEWKKQDIWSQMEEKITPDVIKREYVEKDGAIHDKAGDEK